MSKKSACHHVSNYSKLVSVEIYFCGDLKNYSNRKFEKNIRKTPHNDGRFIGKH